MIVTAIAAMSPTGVIGDGVKMPWHLPRDLKRFRLATMGKPLIMGRLTADSLGRPLPGRLNIVLSRSKSYRPEGFQVARSIEEALTIAAEQGGEADAGEVMIIGGGVVYRETVPLWDRLLLTLVEGEFAGDTVFPRELAGAVKWWLMEQEHHAADARNPFPHWFLALERVSDQAAVGPEPFNLAAWLDQQAGRTTDSPLPPS